MMRHALRAFCLVIACLGGAGAAWPQALAVDDFDNGVLDRWSPFGPYWSESGGLFHSADTPPNTPIAAVRADGSSWADYSVEADVRPLAQGCSSAVSLVFRFQEEFPVGDYCDCSLHHCSAKSLTLACPGGVSMLTPFAWQTGEWYRLRASAVGTTVTCEVVGVPSAFLTAEAPGAAPAGTAGLRSTHIPSSFDDFVVTAEAAPRCNPGEDPTYIVGTLAAGINPTGVAFSDFDGDGDQDLAVSNNASNTLAVYLGDGAGGFAPHLSLPIGPHSQQVAAADFNGDGHLDLAVAISAPPYNLTVALGDGAGSFAVVGQFPTLPRALSVAVADFDADGALDLATQSLDDDAVSVFWGDGAGGFGSRSDLPVGDFPNYVVAADFDGDALPDLACTNRESDSVSVLLSLGARQFGPASFIPVGDGPDSLAAADFDGDGALDLAVAANLGDQIDLLTGQGDGSFVPSAPLTGVESGPHAIVAADVDLDGAPDLAFNNNHNNLTLDFRTLSIALGDGAGGFQDPVRFPVGKQPALIAAEDLNGDGVPDFAVTNLNSNDVTVLSSIPPCTVTLPAVQDSFIRRGASDTNEGANPSLRIQSTGKNRVLAAFDPGAIRTEGLVHAELVLTISDIADNWGTSGRTVSAHRLLAPWTEGNGWSVGGDGRGDGPGVTWACATDAEIANQLPDCGEEWDGGAFAPASGPGVLHTNAMTGEVAWDVTADVLAGATYGWILAKDLENQNGKVFYHSRESAAAAGDPGLAPRLVLEYAP